MGLMLKQMKLITKDLITLTQPASAATHGYRALFSKVDRHCRERSGKLITITSATKGEGKTTSIANLAVIAANDFDKRCLLIDGDFHNPSVGKYFNLAGNRGLLDIIKGKCHLGETIQGSPLPNLKILPMGGDTDIGANVWASHKIKEILEEARAWFDYIWIDAPPILPLFDMTVISDSVDRVLLVVQSEKIPSETLAQAIKSLGSKKLIGTILNRTKPSRQSKYYQYGY